MGSSQKVAQFRPRLGPVVETAKSANGPSGVFDDLAVSDLAVNSAAVPVLTLTVPDDNELHQFQASRQDTFGTLKYLQNDKRLGRKT